MILDQFNYNEVHVYRYASAPGTQLKCSLVEFGGSNCCFNPVTDLYYD